MTQPRTETALPQAVQELIEQFKREVTDKIGVVASGCYSLPFQRAVNRYQAEVFLVELFEAGLRRALEGRAQAPAPDLESR